MESSKQIEAEPQPRIRIVREPKNSIPILNESSIVTPSTLIQTQAPRRSGIIKIERTSKTINDASHSLPSSSTLFPSLPNNTTIDDPSKPNKSRRKQRVIVDDQSLPPSQSISKESSIQKEVRQSLTRTRNPSKPQRSQLQEDSQESLSSSITRRLITSQYECMICYDTLRQKDQTWSCQKCYSILHLKVPQPPLINKKCIKVWASHSTTTSSINLDEAWRCPGCQTPHQQQPKQYLCHCRKQQNPKNTSYLTPHACDQVCLKMRECGHACAQKCHPGPCLPCQGRNSK